MTAIPMMRMPLNLRQGLSALLMSTALVGMTSIAGYAADATKSGDIETVVVTTTKMGSDMAIAPVAATAVSAEDLSKHHMVNMNDIGATLPGFVYNFSSGYGQAYIRGIGSNFATLGTESSVGTYVDGVYLERQSGSALDLVDLANVTVLNGPQGTLYGRNATGGVILVQTADPTNEFSGSVRGEYGNFNQAMGQGVVNVPINDTLAARVAVQVRSNGGFLTDLNTGNKIGHQESVYIRAKLRWAPTDNFNAVYMVEHYNLHSRATQQTEILPAPYCLSCAIFPTAPLAINRGFYVSTQSASNFNNNRFVAHTLSLNYTGDNFTLASVTGFRDQNSPALNDLDAIGPVFFYGQLSEFGTSFTNDTYVRTKFDYPLNALVGATILKDKDRLDFPFGGIITGGLTGDNDEHLSILSYSFYGELNYDFGGGFKAVAGGRYNHDRKSINVVNDALATAFFGAGTFSEKASWNSFTPRAVLSYENSDGYYYASYNRGVKSGAFPSPAVSPASPASPEKLDNFEIGAKNTWLDGRLHTTWDFFYGIYKNVQVQTVNGLTASIILQNAASGRLSGSELTAKFDVTPNFNIGGGFTYMDNYFKSFPNAAIYSPGGTPGCPAPATGLGLSACSADASGTQLPRSPKYSGFVTLDYTQDLSAGWMAHLSTVAHFTSKYNFDALAGGPLKTDVQNGYTKVDASLTITLPDGATDIGGYVTNLFEAHYKNYANVGAIMTYYNPSMPRAYGVRATHRF